MANPVSGSFDTAADWSTGTVPGPSDEAILNAPGSTPYTVTALTSETVGLIRLARKATLQIAGGVFAVELGGIMNAGTIAIGNGGLGATLQLAEFDIGATLTGGGTVSLSDSAENSLELAKKNATLTNVDNTIVGSGTVKGTISFSLINDSAGVIEADNKTPLVIKGAVGNFGLIETTGKGHCSIRGLFYNNGVLQVGGGKLTCKGAAGSGSAVISAGTLDVKGGFNQNVSFTGKRGELDLARTDANQYTAAISGFSTAGKTSLDLGDIGFVSSTEASYSGTATSGVLTVTDGFHTARINMVGDYTAATFTASDDGKGGTVVVAFTTGAATSAQRFVAAAAGLARPAGEVVHAGAALAAHAPILSRPHAVIA